MIFEFFKMKNAEYKLKKMQMEEDIFKKELEIIEEKMKRNLALNEIKLQEQKSFRDLNPSITKSFLGETQSDEKLAFHYANQEAHDFKNEYGYTHFEIVSQVNYSERRPKLLDSYEIVKCSLITVKFS